MSFGDETTMYIGNSLIIDFCDLHKLSLSLVYLPRVVLQSFYCLLTMSFAAVRSGIRGVLYQDPIAICA
jgi:hypothetical protein